MSENTKNNVVVPEEPTIVPNVEPKVVNPTDVEFKGIVETLIEEFGDFSVETIPLVLPQLIAHVQIYKNMNGKQKKQTIINMLKHIVDVTDGPGNDDIWDPIIKRLIPGLIDTLIAVENGKLRMKKPKCKLFGLCR